MTDSRARSGAGAAAVASVAILLVGGVIAPAALTLCGAFLLSPFLGQQPTSADHASAAAWCWAGFVVSAVAFGTLLTITVMHRKRARTAGLTTLVLIAVVAGAAGGVWLVVAESQQSKVASVVGELP